MSNLVSFSPDLGAYILVPLLPLLAFVVTAFFSRAEKNRIASLSITLTLAALVLSLGLAWLHWDSIAHTGEPAAPIMSLQMLVAGDAPFVMKLSLDRPGFVLLTLALLVSTVVQVFTIRHLSTDRRLGWMMALLGLFTSAFVVLIFAADLLTMLVASMAMGFVACLLSVFWWESRRCIRPTMTMLFSGLVASGCLVFAVVISFGAYGTASFDGLAAYAGSSEFAPIVVFVIIAALARSMQLPLFFGELASSTEPLEPAAFVNTFGLLSAGSMLLYRAYPLITAYPQAITVLLVAGSIVAPLAAAIACIDCNIRKIFAYSTASQFGLILVAFGANAPTLALLHLAANAFFAPLLGLVFSVLVRNTGTRDIRHMGGLFTHMPVTAVFATVGALSLVGVIPFAGFLSRDGLVDVLSTSGNVVACALLLATTFLSGIYIGRVLSHAFLGRNRHPYATDPSRIELTCLAVLVLGTCALGLAGFLSPAIVGSAAVRPQPEATLVSALVAVVALWASWMLFSVDERRESHLLANRIKAFKLPQRFADVVGSGVKAIARLVNTLDTRPALSFGYAVVVCLIVLAVAVMSL